MLTTDAGRAICASMKNDDNWACANKGAAALTNETTSPSVEKIGCKKLLSELLFDILHYLHFHTLFFGLQQNIGRELAVVVEAEV